MLYTCTTTTKQNVRILKKMQIARSHWKSSSVDYYGQIVNWPGKKSKSNNKKGKKVWKLLWKTCWHPASDLSFSKWCNCDHLEYWFPMGESSQNSNNLGCANVLWIPKMQQLFFMVGATGLSRLMICFRGWLAVNITSIIPSLFPDRAAHGT